jgi:hypothetical protein
MTRKPVPPQKLSGQIKILLPARTPPGQKLPHLRTIRFTKPHPTRSCQQPPHVRLSKLQLITIITIEVQSSPLEPGIHEGGRETGTARFPKTNTIRWDLTAVKSSAEWAIGTEASSLLRLPLHCQWGYCHCLSFLHLNAFATIKKASRHPTAVAVR